MVAKLAWGGCSFTVHPLKLPPSAIVPKGRVRWALECLVAAGKKGGAPIDDPGPHWSSYVNVLHKAGLPLETIRGPHGKAFSSTHARCVLCCVVTHIQAREVVQ